MEKIYYYYKVRFQNEIKHGTLEEIMAFGEPHNIQVMLNSNIVGSWVWLDLFLLTYKSE